MNALAFAYGAKDARNNRPNNPTGTESQRRSYSNGYARQLRQGKSGGQGA